MPLDSDVVKPTPSPIKAKKLKRKLPAVGWLPITLFSLTMENIASVDTFASHLESWTDKLTEWDLIFLEKFAGEPLDFVELIARDGFVTEKTIDVLKDGACLYRCLFILMVQAACVRAVSACTMTEKRFKRYHMLMRLVASGSVFGDRCARAITQRLP